MGTKTQVYGCRSRVLDRLSRISFKITFQISHRRQRFLVVVYVSCLYLFNILPGQKWLEMAVFDSQMWTWIQSDVDMDSADVDKY